MKEEERVFAIASLLMVMGSRAAPDGVLLAWPITLQRACLHLLQLASAARRDVGLQMRAHGDEPLL
jgi:hypothetical protein